MTIAHITDLPYARMGLYYYKDMTLHFLNTETLEETIFDEVEGIPNLIYAGADDACWMQDDATSHRYNCFRPRINKVNRLFILENPIRTLP